MNLLNILYEPYFIIIVLALIITGITYYNIRNVDNDNNETKTNVPKVLLITFISSFVVLIAIKFTVSYMNKNNVFQKGGDIDMSDRLTLVADDVDYGMLDE